MDIEFLKKVKELRDITKIGIVECKVALIDTNGNVMEAVDKLRKTGVLKAKRVAGRRTSEGFIAVLLRSDKKEGVILEVNCETDFVAKKKEFIDYVKRLTDYALKNKIGLLDDLLLFDYHGGKELNDKRLELVSKYNENICIRRVKYVKEIKGFLSSYVHGEHEYGRVGVILTAEGNDSELAYDISMHIAAMAPKYLKVDMIPGDVVVKEKAILFDDIKKCFSGKDNNVLIKILDGRLKKYYEQIVLYNQFFVKSNKDKIEDIIMNRNLKLLKFIRFELGEYIV